MRRRSFKILTLSDCVGCNETTPANIRYEPPKQLGPPTLKPTEPAPTPRPAIVPGTLPGTDTGIIQPTMLIPLLLVGVVAYLAFK